MTTPVTEIIVKTTKLETIDKAIEKVKEIQEANPHRTIKLSIEVSLKD